MAAGANLVVERAVDFVLFCTEYGGEIVSHGNFLRDESMIRIEVEIVYGVGDARTNSPAIVLSNRPRDSAYKLLPQASTTFDVQNCEKRIVMVIRSAL